MTDAAIATETEAPAGKKKRGFGLILGIVGALAFGGGAFYSIYSGMFDPSSFFGGDEVSHGDGHATEAVLTDIAFVPLDPIMISLPPGSSAKHLRFTGQLEVAPDHAAEVTQLMPRVLDVLNTYLRAVEVRDLQDPASIARLRTQMLRRVQVVTGDGRVRDLLITEFILN